MQPHKPSQPSTARAIDRERQRAVAKQAKRAPLVKRPLRYQGLIDSLAEAKRETP